MICNMHCTLHHTLYDPILYTITYEIMRASVVNASAWLIFTCAIFSVRIICTEFYIYVKIYLHLHKALKAENYPCEAYSSHLNNEKLQTRFTGHRSNTKWHIILIQINTIIKNYKKVTATCYDDRMQKSQCRDIFLI